MIQQMFFQSDQTYVYMVKCKKTGTVLVRCHTGDELQQLLKKMEGEKNILVIQYSPELKVLYDM